LIKNIQKSSYIYKKIENIRGKATYNIINLHPTSLQLEESYFPSTLRIYKTK